MKGTFSFYYLQVMCKTSMYPPFSDIIELIDSIVYVYYRLYSYVVYVK